jgi:muramoyltetrapeptide carboxypeptidase LdcA involved in peptidoglycan recycling
MDMLPLLDFSRLCELPPKWICGYSDTGDFTLIDALESGLGRLGVPVIYDADVGHIPPQIQIINGAYGTVDYDDCKAKIRQEMRA